METAAHIFTDLTENNVNRALHFALELTVWIAVGAWGWQHDGALRWLLVLAMPLVVIATWTAFSVPLDPWLPGGRDGDQPWLAIPGWSRLTYEVAVHAIAGWALLSMGQPAIAMSFGAGFLVHYAVSYQRILWLLVR